MLACLAPGWRYYPMTHLPPCPTDPSQLQNKSRCTSLEIVDSILWPGSCEIKQVLPLPAWVKVPMAWCSSSINLSRSISTTSTRRACQELWYGSHKGSRMVTVRKSTAHICRFPSHIHALSTRSCKSHALDLIEGSSTGGLKSCYHWAICVAGMAKLS